MATTTTDVTTSTDIAAALERLESLLLRRPQFALHDDAPATTCWQGGTRIVTSHANGTEVVTDMPRELGGGGEHVTPGWMFRAGLGACVATCIALAAARAGITLQRLEVVVSSRSDTRGILDMTDEGGAPVTAAPRDMALRVRVGATAIEPAALRALIERSIRCSPMACALGQPVSVDLQIDSDPL
jgi:uncharacterized OsmC-like protein